MKKLLLIGLILAICVLAFPQGVMALDDSVTVNANLPLQTFAFDASINTGVGPTWPWVLQPSTANTNPGAINLTVVSSRQWDIAAWDANGNTAPRIAGHMFGDGHTLTNAFEIQMGGTNGNLGSLGPITTFATPGNPILSGNPLVGSQSDYANIMQTTVAGDFGSPNYAITLWFVASELP
jgi:hypothetical protein